MKKLEVEITKLYKKKSRNIGKMSVGSTLRVNTKIVEGGKERLQAFEGVLISKKGRGMNEMITIRKISYGGIGVERTFMLHSPMIDSIKIIKMGEASRAKLYYLRGAFGRKAKKEAMRFDADLGRDELDKLNKEATDSIKEELKKEKKEEAKKEESPKAEAPKKETPKAEKKEESRKEEQKKQEPKTEEKK